MKKLTPQQERFCEEYIVDLNASKAAIRAGYSEKSCRAIASELMTKSQIQDRIIELKLARTERVQVDADFVLRKYYLAADLDIFHFLQPDGSWKNLKDIPEEYRRLITSIDFAPYDPGKILNIKFVSKKSSIDMLAKHTGVLTEKVEIKADETLAGLLAAVGKLKNESVGGS